MAKRKPNTHYCPPKEIRNHIFGRLTAIAPLRTGGRWCWECKCVCGATTTVMEKYLLSANTTSCGCLHREQLAARNTKHGNAIRGRVSREHKIWSHMKDRCHNANAKDYRHYGGRGIKVCERWLESFENFLADMGVCPPKHQLERINNNGNYEPGNCRWATRTEQMRNTRKNVMLTFQGKTMPISQWAEQLKAQPQTLYSRAKAGWGVERILS